MLSRQHIPGSQTRIRLARPTARRRPQKKASHHIRSRSGTRQRGAPGMRGARRGLPQRATCQPKSPRSRPVTLWCTPRPSPVTYHSMAAPVPPYWTASFARAVNNSVHMMPRWRQMAELCACDNEVEAGSHVSDRGLIVPPAVTRRQVSYHSLNPSNLSSDEPDHWNPSSIVGRCRHRQH
jgi:hypothetical protein